MEMKRIECIAAVYEYLYNVTSIANMNKCFGLVEKEPFRCCLLNKQHASFSHNAPEGKINPPK